MIAGITSQILAVVRLELRKTFFARRGLWVYLLAFAPVLLYLGNSIYEPREEQRLEKIAAKHPLSAETLRAVEPGISEEQVLQMLGEPYAKQIHRHPSYGGQQFERALFRYTDGTSDYEFRVFNGVLRRIDRNDPQTLPQNRLIFAAIFQFYYLRLAVLFGCVGIFMNLFRGEMLDKSLHFYLLTPMRREILVAGKFIAGLAAILAIFLTSTALQFPAMLWQFSRHTVSDYMSGSGWHDLAVYLAVTVLACVAYGSVFLAAGLLFRNPIIAAAIVLVWESANLFLPLALKKLSLIFYLQLLCPVVPPAETNLPVPLTLLISPGSPVSQSSATIGIVMFTLMVLVASGVLARKLQINYASD